ncbi:YgiQ family radical SAM protein [Muribaculum sp. An289]|nr:MULTISPECIES: YgiQ family radical SAM protein [unclassified Muribaculum]OUO38201.1 YgiQ family radical SAM protein [Muribaculum sp. An289]OUO44397.1 YgiQ family radical SAM protein [Muribaculum sp. An287]
MFPTTAREVGELGWDYIDIIIFTGDAFIDHPAFGTAVIARYLQKYGYRIAVVPQPNWRDDLRDFRKLGAPRLYFGVNSGAMDSMVNHYTAAKRLRSDDAYTPEGRAGMRPDYAVTVYTRILKSIYPDVPVVIGGVEASLRRLAHYDYWSDSLKPSVLVESGADYLCYGMGERPMLELTRAIEARRRVYDIRKIPQIAFYQDGKNYPDGALVLSPFENCLEDRKAFARNFHHIETAANMLEPPVIVEPCGGGFVRVNPPYPPATEEEMDSFYDLPYTKLPHPKYRGKRIPAYDMIKFSITTHRGCFGGCNFCTIAAHQGKFIQERSEGSILREAAALTGLPGFAGNISDLGAPTANMYGMKGKDRERCARCRRKSCLFPSPCDNMDRSHARLLGLYAKVDALKGIRHSYIGSGIRYDLFIDKDGFVDGTSRKYLTELILKHTSGRLKVAPEHTEGHVLALMAKPSFVLFERLRGEFDRICAREGVRMQLVPYFISGHPGCTMEDMERLSRNRYLEGLYMEQVQDFTPTPMTASSVMFYSGLDPKTLKPVFVERDVERKKRQKSFFFKNH